MRVVLVALLLSASWFAAAAQTGPSDEFEGGISAPWEIVRETRLGWTTETCVNDDPAGCYLTLTPARGDLVGAGNDARNVFLQPVPDGDLRVTTLLAFFPTEEGQRAGLLLYAGDDDLFYFGVGDDGERVLEAVVETAGQADASTVPTDWSPVFLRYERFGDEVTAYASPDGILWTALGAKTVPTGASLRMGLFAAKGYGPRASDPADVLNADFGYFRVESPPQGETRTEAPTFTMTAGPVEGASPFTVSFRAEQSWDYPNLTWSLGFGDGSELGTGQGFPVEIEHTYTRAATYNTVLTVRNAFGIVGTATARVVVEEAGVVPPVEEEPPADPVKEPVEERPLPPGTAPGAVAETAAGVRIVVLDAEGRDVGVAKGTVRLEVPGVPNATFTALGEDGSSVVLLGSTWDTSRNDNGRYALEARSGDAVLATRDVVVENPRASVAETAAAVATGTAVVGLMSAGAGAFGGRLDLLGYLGDAAQNLSEDVARRRTAEIAALDRKRKFRSLVLAGVAVLLNGLLFAYAEVEPWDLVFFLAALPFFAGAALLYTATRYASETEAARATGATVHFRIWVPGALSLIVSSLVFRAPFGYPGFLRKNEPVAHDDATRKRAAGLRALASLGIYLAVTVPFVVAGMWWRYDFAEIGIGMALAAFGSAVLPFQPLPGGNVWRWNKAVSAAVILGGVTLYFLFQLALIPLAGVLLLGLVGAGAAVASAASVRGAVRASSEVEVTEDG